MLTESFIASIRAGPKSAASSSLPKEASIFLHDFQPLPALRGTLKKSSTNPNCLAVTATHIFAAQSDKALIHVYNREKGNQETIVPFPFRITSVTRVGAADDAAILALGTDSGGLLLWELCTGRLVSTDPSHLQAVTHLTVDPTNFHLLSGSPDSSIQVWSVPNILSFTDPGTDDSGTSNRGAPLRHLSAHRGAITSITTGHSHTHANFALSTAEDKSCLIWNYRTGNILHTFLLPEIALCSALDPVDRGFYAGLDDGTVQFVNFHREGSSVNLLYDANRAETPTQVAASDRWRSATTVGSALSIDVSYDASLVLSGHDGGKVLSWEMGRPPAQIADLGQPVTNLMIVPPTGFPNERKHASGVKQLTVVKPRPDAFPYPGGSGMSVPANYNFTAVFAEQLPLPGYVDVDGNDTLMAEFEEGMEGGEFPEGMLRAAVAEIAAMKAGTGEGETVTATGVGNGGGFSGSQEVARLKMQLEMTTVQRTRMAEELVKLKGELDKRDGLARMKERAKLVKMGQSAKAREKKRKAYMGEEKSSARNRGDEGPTLSEDDSDEDMGRD